MPQPPRLSREVKAHKNSELGKGSEYFSPGTVTKSFVCHSSRQSFRDINISSSCPMTVAPYTRFAIALHAAPGSRVSRFNSTRPLCAHVRCQNRRKPCGGDRSFSASVRPHHCTSPKNTQWPALNKKVPKGSLLSPLGGRADNRDGTGTRPHGSCGLLLNFRPDETALCAAFYC